MAGAMGERVVRFGQLELSLETGELRKHGIRVRLQGKPFRILSALLEQPGRVVTREELRSRLWPADTFVEFESGLNTAINRLRSALGDSAENPIYVETLARVGYRFIAPVGAVSSNGGLVAPEVVVESVETPAADPAHGVAPAAVIAAQPVGAAKPKRWWAYAAGAATVLLVPMAAIFALAQIRRQASPEVTFRQVTFRKGFVTNARFTPDGSDIVYSAEWNGGASRVFLGNAISPDARDLGFEQGWLAGLSHTTELAVFIKPRGPLGEQMMLERVSLYGGAPRQVSDRAIGSDWGPDGTLCVETKDDSSYRIEYPPGHILYRTPLAISSLRVSPRGDQVAFLEHPIFRDDAARVVVVDSSGRARVLSSGWGSGAGLAWHPSGKEVWFTAARTGSNRALMAVDLRGHVRQVSQVPGSLVIKDIAASGKVLVARNVQRMNMFYANLKDNSERDVSWLDWSRAVAISEDGKSVLFDESGEGGGKQYGVYLYNTETDSFERQGEGRAMDLSADGRWALTLAADDATKLSLIAVHGGETKAVAGKGLARRWVKFFPDGKSILFAGNYPNQAAAIYRQRLPDGAPVLVASGVEVDDVQIAPTGEIAVGCDGEHVVVLDLQSGKTHRVNTDECATPAFFVTPNKLVTSRRERGAIVLEFLDLATGTVTPYRRFKVSDAPGTMYTDDPRIGRDLQAFVYSRMQILSDLFIVSGWK